MHFCRDEDIVFVRHNHTQFFFSSEVMYLSAYQLVCTQPSPESLFP